MFGRVVRRHRQRLGLSQEHLAEKAGVSVRTIRYMEADQIKAPRPATIAQLADVFGLQGPQREEFCAAAYGRAAPVTPTARQLPAAVANFVGRQAELDTLDAMLTQSRAEADGHGVIAAISGTAGVGKTALALHWAHRVSGQFPDGQLYVNLHGFDAERPTSPADVLVRFLTAIGGANPYIPADLEERAASLRTVLAERRVLIVLDNCANAEQVRPLLPGPGASLVLVTSRDSLAGLVARDGAYRLDLDLLPPADARTLLRRLIGRRVDGEPDAATTLAEQCVRLPLALRVAAELAAVRRGTTLAHLVAELADERQRLSRLDAHGDPRAAVTAVFSWSIHHLSADAARAFRLLGLHPGPDFEPFAAAALLDTSHEHAERLLGLLARAHLLHPTSAGRHAMHDLLHAYAATLATLRDADEDRRAALARLFDYYLGTTAAAMDRLHPTSARYRPRWPAPKTPAPAFAEAGIAKAWLDNELTALAAASAHAASRGWPTHTVNLSMVMNRYLAGGHHTEALAIHGHARQAAGAVGDRSGEAYALLGIGTAHGQLGRYPEAAEHLRQALILFRQTNDGVGEARVLGNLGNVEERQSNHETAFGYFSEALALHRQNGDQHSETATLNNIGIAEGRLGRYGQATGHLTRALLLAQQIGDRRASAVALTSLGYVEDQHGRHGPAVEYLEQALMLFDQIGERRGHAYTLTNLGSAYHHLRRLDQAVDRHQQALTFFRESGDRDGQATALNGLGEADHAGGRQTNALIRHAEALTTASDIGSRDQQARAHTGLAHAHQALGDLTHARHHYEQALAIYTMLGTPHAGKVQAHLSALLPVICRSPACSDATPDS